MLSFNAVRVLRSGKKYIITMNTNMSEDNGSGNNPTRTNHKSDVNCETETRILTQEDVTEHIKNYNAPLTKQLDDLTRLIHSTAKQLPKGKYQRWF